MKHDAARALLSSQFKPMLELQNFGCAKQGKTKCHSVWQARAQVLKSLVA
jgi:hypothetical protein